MTVGMETDPDGWGATRRHHRVALPFDDRSDVFMQKEKRRLNRFRVLVVYLCCALGAAIAPLESYITTGEVGREALSIAVISFLVGSVTATLVILSMIRRGRFMQFRL